MHTCMYVYICNMLIRSYVRTYVCMYVCMLAVDYRSPAAVHTVRGEVRPRGGEEEQRAEQPQRKQNAEEQPAVSFSDAVPERYCLIIINIFLPFY